MLHYSLFSYVCLSLSLNVYLFSGSLVNYVCALSWPISARGVALVLAGAVLKHKNYHNNNGTINIHVVVMIMTIITIIMIMNIHSTLNYISYYYYYYNDYYYY